MYKGQGKGMGALEQPYEPEPQWQDDAWANRDSGWNLIGAVSKAKPPNSRDVKAARARAMAIKVENKCEVMHEDDGQGIEDNSIKVNTRESPRRRCRK